MFAYVSAAGGTMPVPPGAPRPVGYGAVVLPVRPLSLAQKGPDTSRHSEAARREAMRTQGWPERSL